ncbi:hypothetical protein ABBQ38_011887 [Trebouxia sp. C0009 RCD-2024]
MPVLRHSHRSKHSSYSSKIKFPSDQAFKVICPAAESCCVAGSRPFLSMAKGIVALQKLREQAATLKKYHPDWSFNKIGKKIGCRHSFVSRWVRRDQACEPLHDQSRSGRPPKADAAAQEHIVMAAQLPECRTAADVAAKLQQDQHLSFSVTTVKRVLRQHGLQHLSPVARPMLTDSHKLARVKFAKAVLRRDKTSKRRWLNTDSKIFHLHKMGRPLRRWCSPGARGTVPRPKHSIAAHVYMGICYWGVTKLMFVTGTHKQVSKFVNPKSKRLYAGVGSSEYSEVLSQMFVPEDNRLFQQAGQWADKWQLQQDNAKPHKTATNMAYIAENVPGGHFLTWPACSPDMSPIENMWAWMEGKLHKEYQPKNVEELKDSLEQIRQSIPASMLHNMFDGFQARMQRVVDLDGEYINM